jgi:uncharacterized protein (TIGR02271 family)
MIDATEIRDLIGARVSSNDGDKLGSIGQVFLDDGSGRPEWVTVQTGLFGTKESFVPLAEATRDGDELRVPYTKDQVKGAPNVSPDGGHLSPGEEAALYRHYGLDYSQDGSGGGVDTGRYESARDHGDRGVGHDVSGANTDDAMTRSEEQLRTGTETVQTGKARLRKWVETEQVDVSVPVTKEKARLETEPITDENRGAALDGPAISEEEHEVTLTEERPVVAKETVPVERVRLTKDAVQDAEHVSEELRKERVDTDGDIDLNAGQEARR